MKDKGLEKMKQDYEEIHIPRELRQRVEMGIHQAKEEERAGKRGTKMKKQNKAKIYSFRIVGGVAAAMLVITVMANSGAAIAHAMEKIPVIGSIARVVTFREYESTTNDMEADVKIPEVRVENEDGTVNEESTAQINRSIEEYTSEIIAQYEADVEAAGGEGKQSVDLQYTVLSDTDRLFSIRFDKTIIMASGSQSVKIYHIDKQTGKMMDLKDLFKDTVNFIDPISGNIKEQMKAQMAADESKTYFIDSEVPEWDFQSIKEDSTFYVDENGKLHIVFDEYEVAPGYMGSVEFEIPTEAVQDIVKEGFLK